MVDNPDTSDTLITLNLRGQRVEVPQSSLTSLRSQKLSQLTQTSSCYNADRKEYCFNANPYFFHCLLDSNVARKEVHVPESMCVQQALEQLVFWGLDESVLAACCFDR